MAEGKESASARCLATAVKLFMCRCSSVSSHATIINATVKVTKYNRRVNELSPRRAQSSQEVSAARIRQCAT